MATKKNKETALSASVDAIMEDIMSEKEKFAIFREMAKIEGIDNFFRALKKSDILNYFGAQKEAQDSVRGAFSRTDWMHSQIKATRGEKKDNKETSTKSPRHE